MLFDKLPLTHKSYDNNHEMIIENKEEMILENKEEMLNQTLINVLMVDTLYEKNFLIYIYILHKYFKKDDIHYKSITDYYFTDYTYEENLITNNFFNDILITNNGFNNLLEKMINNSLFLEIVKLIKTLCDNYFLKNIELIRNKNYNEKVIEDEFNTIDNTLDNFDDLSEEQKKYNTIINEKIGMLKFYEVFKR